jgi:Cu/Ag efflux protein CusF
MKRTSVATKPVAPKPVEHAKPIEHAQEIHGKVRDVDPTGTKLTLADGTELLIPEAVKFLRAELRPGATVTATYEELNGHKVVQHLQVSF